MKEEARTVLEAIYRKWCKAGHASSAHLPTLRSLAEQCWTCVEFGTKNGASASAMLLGCAGPVWSYDIATTPRATELKALAGDRWHYCIEDTRTANVPNCDLLFVDAMHNYNHVKVELEKHADKVRKYIAFHDTITFGSVGAVDETGKAIPGVLGIRPAVDELMIRDQSWIIIRHDYHSHGFLVLARRGK